MPLSWNEIRHNAIRFTKEWQGETREEAEGKSFWDEFFHTFGIRRRTVASFEEPVKNIRGQYSFIDLFWPKMLLVEHKSFGKDLGKAESQAMRYIADLAREGREKETPRYVIVSDFARIALHDLDEDTSITFPLAEFHQHIHAFAFIPGYQQHKFEEQDPINIEATEMLGELHDALEAGGYSGHNLERFLVRVLFCLFGEDTGIFEREAFKLYLENHTKEDGSDLGLHLARLFDILNKEKRQANLDEDLAAFPYVNGDLFGEHLGFADFNRDMRNALLAATRFDWSRISPAIFGSLFQAVMEPKERRQIGGHYTSERDILKVIRALFLDELWAEFEKIAGRPLTRPAATLSPAGGEGRGEGAATGMKRKRLEAFHQRLARLRFLDPACGCGNFLVITYRELRLLEIEILKLLYGDAQQELDIQNLSLVDVDQFSGIEISEWPARIAEVAMWLMDHQMNLRLSEAFGQYFVRLPLKKSPHIVCANALRLDWKEVLPPGECSYVLGNPPFIGKTYQTRQQRSDLLDALSNFRNIGDVDYVVGWFKRAAEYIRDTRIKVGFVATNSITQGEQVPVVWGELLDRYHLTIHFAHRSFPWMSEARGKAHVHVVIIGFAAHADGAKKLYEYAANGLVTQTEVACINPYLLPGALTLVRKQQTPLASVPQMRCGNKPSDGGHLILDDDEQKALLAECPDARKFLKRFVGSEELINGIDRWCLWLDGANPEEWRALPAIKQRVERVRDFRLRSTALPTKKAAERPATFFYQSQPATSYVAVPEVSSENRTYIPIAFLPPDVIASNKLYIVESKDVYLFGVLSSAMHMAWVKVVAGRLESRFQYSGSMVYNTFPWPESASDEKKARVRAAAEEVLKQRVECGDGRLGFLPKANDKGWRCSLATLYGPLTMPKSLVKAHDALDRAVDRCYRKEPFTSERLRVEFLFALYQKITAPLLAAAKPKRAARKQSVYTQPPPAPTPPILAPEPTDADAAQFYYLKEESPPDQP